VASIAGENYDENFRRRDEKKGTLTKKTQEKKNEKKSAGRLGKNSKGGNLL